MSTSWEGIAPGRLDVLGGIADYSGSLVLQMPIRGTTNVAITTLPTADLEFTSDHEGSVQIPLPDAERLAATTENRSLLRTWLDTHQVPHWAHYPLGCFLLFCQAKQWHPETGLRFGITSQVPVSMGVSSSAALEVATLRALEAASGRTFTGTALARLAQRAENEIVGAPCGLMDQLAAVHGRSGALLPILCRPDLLDELVPLPEEVAVVGWPSGVKHAVSASPYATARAAAFMGKKLLERTLSKSLSYLTVLSPSLVRSQGEDALPITLSGADFLRQVPDGVDDPLTTIHPDKVYPVQAATTFPIEENFRASLAVHLLRGSTGQSRVSVLETVGELMYQAHTGYSSIGLGCPETDAMVEAVRRRGPRSGFYGARVSGGGSGGTVVVLLEKHALAELERVSQGLSFLPAGSTRLIS